MSDMRLAYGNANAANIRDSAEKGWSVKSARQKWCIKKNIVLMNATRRV